MKNVKRVVVTLEMETSLKLVDVKSFIKDSLPWRKIKLIQIQANLIKK